VFETDQNRNNKNRQNTQPIVVRRRHIITSYI